MRICSAGKYCAFNRDWKKIKGRSIPCLVCVQGRACHNTVLCFCKIGGSQRIASHARGRWRLLLIDRYLFDHGSQPGRNPAVRGCCGGSIRMSYKVHSNDTYIRPARISTTSVPTSLERRQFPRNTSHNLNSHEIDFSEHADSTCAFWIDLPC